MPHTNNPNAAKRKANRNDAPKFLKRQKKQKPTPAVDGDGDAADGVDGAAGPSCASALANIPRAEYTKLINDYHALEKNIAATNDPKEKERLRAKQEAMGGLQKYQEASLHGGDKSRGGESGKWCVKQLMELKVGVAPSDKGKEKAKVVPKIVIVDGKETKVWPPKPVREKLRLLDVGAITGTSFANWKWIDTTCIDLNPQAPHVQKYDFFDFPVPSQDKLFDVVSLSLVVNFIGSLSKRGEILQHAHKYLKPTGLLYLVLPLPCLTNSRYCTHERLESILTTTGWEKVRQHDSAKLTYWLCSRVGEGKGDGKVWKKEEVRAGVHRNNFCILVNTTSGDNGAKKGEDEEEWTGVKDEEEEEWKGVEEEEWKGVQEDGAEEEWGGIAN
ncbi:nucleolus protein [Pseudohyphozyma bogoriensis]|nr:nucleolus protein [Pseudohyphozyma bogoriensis]